MKSNWRKSSYSTAQGNCVQVDAGCGRVLVQDTKDRTGPVLRFSPAAWRRFADQVKRALLACSLARIGAALSREGRPRRGVSWFAREAGMGVWGKPGTGPWFSRGLGGSGFPPVRFRIGLPSWLLVWP
jgi:hypothetical protein